jgi:hypothetical protein
MGISWALSVTGPSHFFYGDQAIQELFDGLDHQEVERHVSLDGGCVEPIVQCVREADRC